MSSEPSQQEVDSIQHFFNQKKIGDAIKICEKLITKYPESYVAWNLLGVCTSRVGDRTKAKKALIKSTQINPNYAEAHCNLGSLAMTQGDLDAALSSFKTAVGIRPSYREALINMSIVLKKKGNLVEAIRAQKQAIQLSSNTIKKQALPIKSIKFQKFQHLDSVYTRLDAPRAAKLTKLIKPERGFSLEFDPNSELQPINVHIKNASILGQSNIILNERYEFALEKIVFNENNADKILNLNEEPFFDFINSRYYFTDEISIKKGIFLGTHWNFGHWIFNHIMRLFFINQDIWKYSNIIVSDSLNENYTSVLISMGIPTENIIRVKTSQILHVEDLLIPQMPWVQLGKSLYMAKQCLPWMRKQLGVNENTNTNENKKVFITRENEKHRRVTNEQELYQIAQGFGFDLVDIGRLSTKEQLILGQKTSHLISPMGANSTFFLYTRNNAKMLELSLPLWQMNIMGAFAKASSLEYTALIGTEIESETASILEQDFHIDPLKFTNELHKLMDYS